MNTDNSMQKRNIYTDYIRNGKYMCRPDISVNRELFEEQIRINKQDWDAAVGFIETADLQMMSTGYYAIENDVYATISEYKTKRRNEARYEAHRKYIDLQYIISGEEYIELCPLGMMKRPLEYNEEKDIIFFDDITEGKMIRSQPDIFFIFFPDDAHKPGLSIEAEGASVKKLVVKIPYRHE